jgi:hypothetical protein
MGMIREAELFVIAEQVLVEVIGRIRPGDGATVLPPLFPGHDKPTPITEAVARHARDDAAVPEALGGVAGEVGDDPAAAVPRLAEAACAAARTVTDGDAKVGKVTVRDHLLRLTVARSFLAHDIAMHLGSRACPLTEEQAKGLWEITEPEAQSWRDQGIFAEPLTPVPADVSWRDRFLMSAGRDPHALDH